MADEQTETSRGSTDQAHPTRRRGSKIAIAIVVVVLLAAAAMAAWQVFAPRPDLQARVLNIFRSFPFTASGTSQDPIPALEVTPLPAFTNREAVDLVSKENILMMVGRLPGDTSQALLHSLEQPGSSASAEEKQPNAAPVQEKPPLSKPPEPPAEASTQTTAAPGPAPQLVETPIVQPRGPGSTKRQKKTKQETPAIEPPKAPPVEPSPVTESTEQVEKEAPAPKTPTVKPPGRVANLKPAGPEGEAKPEKYQLPGSLLVDVENYRGAKVKWGLMVIMDDSAAMAKKLKTWESSRLDVASQLVAKLPPALTTGSKLAVRDFYCKKPDSKAAGLHLCLTHNLYPWSDLPCRGLEEKLTHIDPGGLTNPCAAAAYVIKSGFDGLGDLKPRVLIVTAGAKRCKPKGILAETDKKGARGAVRIDVLALGMSKKGLQDYTALTGKTGGTLMKIERPADLEPVLARYTKVLQRPAMKQMDVQGEKASLKIGNGEELTLAPGTYTVVLPQMPGLDQSKRTIKNVRIVSGETSVLNVNITKGRVQVTTGKK